MTINPTNAHTPSFSLRKGVKNWTQVALNKSNRAFWISLGGLTTYKLFDVGLAYFLGLEILSHGTNPISYININLNGADPRYGGTPTGASYIYPNDDFGFIHSSKGYFHVAYSLSNVNLSWLFAYIKRHPQLILDPDLWLVIVSPRQFPLFSSMSYLNSLTGHRTNQNLVLLDRASTSPLASNNPCLVIAAVIMGLCTPLLKFKFMPESICAGENNRFEFDNDWLFAYKTKYHIGPSQLGITGSITQGIDRRTFQRMQDRPVQSCIGALLLGMAGRIGVKTYRYYKLPAERTHAAEPLSYPKRMAKIPIKIAKNCIWGGVALMALII